MNKTMIRRKECINELGNTYRTLIIKLGYNEKFCHECIHAFDTTLRKHGFTYSIPMFDNSGAAHLFKAWIIMNGSTPECFFLERKGIDDYLASFFTVKDCKRYVNGKNTPKDNWDDLGFDGFYNKTVEEWMKMQTLAC